MAYEPTAKEKETAKEWLRQQSKEYQEGIDNMGYLPVEWDELLTIMNEYAAFNLREFCKDLHTAIEKWEESEACKNGIPVADIFEAEIINQFK